MQSQAADQAVVLAPVVDARAAVGRRFRGALIMGPCLTVIVLAAWLAPKSAGYGTHRELGLPPCGFLAQTGYPCPSCGMTTSFAAMAHGHLVDAFLAQPCGMLLFLAVVVMATVGFGELTTGRDLIRYLHPGLWWVVGAVSAMLLGWGFKIAYGLATGILPVQ